MIIFDQPLILGRETFRLIEGNTKRRSGNLYWIKFPGEGLKTLFVPVAGSLATLRFGQMRFALPFNAMSDFWANVDADLWSKEKPPQKFGIKILAYEERLWRLRSEETANIRLPTVTGQRVYREPGAPAFFSSGVFYVLSYSDGDRRVAFLQWNGQGTKYYWDKTSLVVPGAEEGVWTKPTAEIAWSVGEPISAETITAMNSYDGKKRRRTENHRFKTSGKILSFSKAQERTRQASL